jgi:hypothetical protein
LNTALDYRQVWQRGEIPLLAIREMSGEPIVARKRKNPLKWPVLRWYCPERLSLCCS